MDISRCEKFIELTQMSLAPHLEDLKETALEDGIPIIRPSVQGFLRFLMKYASPSDILEIGTAVGFSALLMHEYAPDAKIITIENYEPRLVSARKNIASHGDGKIKLIEGNAEEVLPGLTDAGFDLIFLDAAKGQYITLLPDIIRLLAPGGLLVSDNVMQDGDVIESRFAVRRRDRTIHERMREYLKAVSDSPELESSILPMADGVTISVRKDV